MNWANRTVFTGDNLDVLRGMDLVPWQNEAWEWYEIIVGGFANCY